MKCKQCPEGRRFARGSVECLLYGFIIREDHEGMREGCKRHENGDLYELAEAEPQEDGWDAVDSLPGFLSEA